MTLPTPLEMSVFGAALLLGAAALFWFVPTLVKLALGMAGVGVLLLACAGVAYDYELMGEDKLKPQVTAAKAEAAQAMLERDHAKADTNVCVGSLQAQNQNIKVWQDAANANYAASKEEAAKSAQRAASSQAQIKTWQAIAAAKEAANQTAEQKLAAIDKLLRDAAKARADAAKAMPVTPMPGAK